MIYQPLMEPRPGERLLRFVGDCVRFVLRDAQLPAGRNGLRAVLRTNLGRARRVQEEIIRSYTSKLPLAGSSWRDIPMHPGENGWWIDLPLVEVGFFQAKAYLIDEAGRQVWPEGSNVGVSVHPDQYRTANTIYCAFVRMFGSTKTAVSTRELSADPLLAKLDKQGYAVIPPSGKLRDLIAQLPHITETLGCRILHLLPVNPTPTTYARFGRFGSPYAAQDLLAVDPALVEFDRRTTGIDQFRELTYGAHLRGARVFLDVVTNHTGWGSTVQENHPDWFLREANGQFASPGAWGTVWEDLVELDHRNPASWEHLAEVFLTWCRRGVDGFRCDAGYKVPMPAWRYITACVRQEYPETLFLLEGLGGSWEATETLLTDGGMQWAYSELFQNYSGSEVASYLDYAHRQSERAGLYVHYSETHDNDRLAARGRAWSLLRNQLSALTSASGGFGFTCGVEWLAPEKINVHSSRGLNWGCGENLTVELAQLNRLLAAHPCFYDGAKLTRLSPVNAAIYALRRDSAEGLDHVLVLVNTDTEKSQSWVLQRAAFEELGAPQVDLIKSSASQVQIDRVADEICFTLQPAAGHCLAPTAEPAGLSGDAYRRARACAAFGLEALSRVLPVGKIGSFSWRTLSEHVSADPGTFLATLQHLDTQVVALDLVRALELASAQGRFPQVVIWDKSDRRRITLVPPEHWLLVRDDFSFRTSLVTSDDAHPWHTHAIRVQSGYVACFPPQTHGAEAKLLIERYAPDQTHLDATIRFLGSAPNLAGLQWINGSPARATHEDPLVLLTNGRGSMARFCSDLGRVTSKYDCLLGANLHPSVPVDRHVFVKRARVWLVADRFITPLDRYNMVLCEPGPPARWRFVGHAGDGRTIEIHLEVDMLEGCNSTVLRFSRPSEAAGVGTDLPSECDVRLTVRIDLEDRSFHAETKRTGGADYHFSSHCRPLKDRIGFEFTPAEDRQLRVVAQEGAYLPQAEWSEGIAHPIEQTRGQVDRGDAYSPGWFDLPLPKAKSIVLLVTADPEVPSAERVQAFAQDREAANERSIALAQLAPDDLLGQRLALAAHQFVVRRGEGKTVIAGYPWFLDWGRDTFICARGLLSAGLVDVVQQLLVTFGRFEDRGTLPNSIYGEDASNRDTTDAPLWYGIVCEEVAPLASEPVYDIVVDSRGRTVRDVLRSIAEGYLRGTPNGIAVDPESGLVWSPSHFTWMDTNYPAATPREGYPVEIQALWIRLLRQLARVDAAQQARWTELATRAEASLRRLFWLEAQGWLADLVIAQRGQSAASGVADTALRSNGLVPISLGLLTGQEARRCVQAALRYLVVPGALRSLAPLPVSPPLPVYAPHGGLLNNPAEPYWGRYQGDEDTQRKPAYHNGTAWTWTFPIFCEALARAWDFQPEAVAAARAYLSSIDRLLTEGCLGQLPEIVDGDAPHLQRGCDAQAWGVTEALRVWKQLQSVAPFSLKMLNAR